MSKAWSAIKDKIEFFNFQVNLRLLIINIMGFWSGFPNFYKINNKIFRVSTVSL